MGLKRIGKNEKEKKTRHNWWKYSRTADKEHGEMCQNERDLSMKDFKSPDNIRDQNLYWP